MSNVKVEGQDGILLRQRKVEKSVKKMPVGRRLAWQLSLVGMLTSCVSAWVCMLAWLLNPTSCRWVCCDLAAGDFSSAWVFAIYTGL